MDVALKRLPDPLTLPSYVIGAVLLGAAAPFTGGGGGRLGHALIGMAALWALFAVQWLVLPKAIGRGDVKLAGVLGLYLGWLGLDAWLLGVVATFLIGGLVAPWRCWSRGGPNAARSCRTARSCCWVHPARRPRPRRVEDGWPGPAADGQAEIMLNDAQVEAFVRDGFVRLDGAVPADLVADCREILWRDTGADPGDRSTWTAPVVRLGDYAQEPFRAAANTPRLHAAFDTLVGKGRWQPRGSLGTFPVRFPSDEAPGDDGWHVESSFAGEDPFDYMKWRINVSSKGRALLLLFLFSDVGQDDAPTRVRVGSHLDVPPILEPAGEDGMAFMDLCEKAVPASEHRPVAYATGQAGDVFLCHPFIVHAAQPHRGTEPRFMAQPPLLPAEGEPARPERADGAYSPVETAIRRGLGR